MSCPCGPSSCQPHINITDQPPCISGQVYESMREAGVPQCNKTHTVMLSMLLRSDQPSAGSAIVARLRQAEAEGGGVRFDMSLRNVMLQTLLKNGEHTAAQSLLSEFRAAGGRPSERSARCLTRP